MMSAMTLDGTTRRRALGDIWSDTTSGTSSAFAADFSTSAFGWGILAFAVGSLGYRAAKRFR